MWYLPLLTTYNNNHMIIYCFYFVYQSLILMTWCEVLLPCYPFLLITKCYRQFLENRPLFYNLSWFFVYFKFIISFLSSSQESLVKIREHNWLGLYGKTQWSNANNHGGELRFNNIKQILLTSHSFWINENVFASFVLIQNCVWKYLHFRLFGGE